MRSLRLLILPLLGLLMVAVSACTDLTGTQGGSYVTGDGQITVWPTAERGEPVDLKGDTLDGGTYDSVADRGKPVVVNVWWSNCGPCRTEMPLLADAAADLGDTASFIGINTRDNSADNGLAFERSIGVDYPSIFSPDGQALLAIKKLPRAVPATVILDAEGRMAAAIAGEIPTKLTLTQLVQCIADGAADQQCKVSGT
jgi:thiol-disulfide isomerase/thioredoxin